MDHKWVELGSVNKQFPYFIVIWLMLSTPKVSIILSKASRLHLKGVFVEVLLSLIFWKNIDVIGRLIDSNLAATPG